MTALDGVGRVLLTQLAAFLAALLAASAAHKALRWRRTESVVQTFARVPQRAAAGAAFAACLAEAVSGTLLVLPDYRRAGALLAAAVLGVYLTLITRAVIQHRGDVDCGCSFGGRRNLGAFEICRNAVLLAFAAILAVYSREAAPLEASQLLAACALLAVYGALDQVMGLQPLRRGELL